MKRIRDASRNDKLECDRKLSRMLQSDTQKAVDGCGPPRGGTEDTSESDASDTESILDKCEAEDNSDFVGGILSSRVCKSKIPRWRMRKFLFISFNEEGPYPDFMGCPEWAKPMLAVYYQVALLAPQFQHISGISNVPVAIIDHINHTQ